MNNTEIAWAAGFFDGEGCSSSRANGRGSRNHPSLHVSQNNRDTLERFQAAVGGVGAIYERNNGRHFDWQAQTKESTKKAMEALWPYLGQHKKNQYMNAMLDYLDVVQPYPPRNTQ